MTRFLKISRDPFTRQKHGEKARLISSGKIPVVAFDVLLPDGSRMPRVDWRDPESGLWRRPRLQSSQPCSGQFSGWVYGYIEIEKLDITFRDEAHQPRSRWNWPPRSLPGDLFASQLVADYLGDETNARSLYDTLCETTWIKDMTQFQFANWRSVANMIAGLRDRTESFLDFAWSGGESDIDEHSRALLQSHGWELLKRRDNSNDAVFAEEIVVACESRPFRPTPLWYAYWALGLSNDDSLDGRMHRCAYRGQASYLEWTDFLSYQCSGELVR